MRWGRLGWGLQNGSRWDSPHPHVHAEHGFAMTGKGNGVIPSEQNVL
jgi:hypothetical protein